MARGDRDGRGGGRVLVRLGVRRRPGDRLALSSGGDHHDLRRRGQPDRRDLLHRLPGSMSPRGLETAPLRGPWIRARALFPSQAPVLREAPLLSGEPMAISPDVALVEAAQAGSASAFSQLVERHQQALRAFLRRACGDWALADDLAQETFLTAWDRIGRLQKGASVRAWLCGIAYNKHLSSVRSRSRERAREAAYEAERPPSAGAMTDERLTLETAM